MTYRSVALAGLAALLTVATPAGASRPACRRSSTAAPRFSAWVAHDGPFERDRTELTVCDHRSGRRRVLARGLFRGTANDDVGQRAGRGRLIWAASAAGHRLAWVDGRTGGGHTVSLLHVADLRTNHELRRSVIWRGRRNILPTLAVALTERGDLASTAPPRRRGELNRLLLRSPDGHVRVVARDILKAGVEDGTTLALFDANERKLYIDLRPPPTRGGCPRRRAFRTVFESGGVRVTSATYETPVLFESLEVQRACLVGTDVDRVVAQDAGNTSEGDVTVPLAAAAPFLFTKTVGDAKGMCGPVKLEVLDVRSGDEARRADGWCDGTNPQAVPVPARPADARLSDAGTPAWTVGVGADTVLAAIDARGVARVLARGPAGTIGDLVVSGDVVRWTENGMPQSADVS